MSLGFHNWIQNKSKRVNSVETHTPDKGEIWKSNNPDITTLNCHVVNVVNNTVFCEMIAPSVALEIIESEGKFQRLARSPDVESFKIDDFRTQYYYVK